MSLKGSYHATPTCSSSLLDHRSCASVDIGWVRSDPKLRTWLQHLMFGSKTYCIWYRNIVLHHTYVYNHMYNLYIAIFLANFPAIDWNAAHFQTGIESVTRCLDPPSKSAAISNANLSLLWDDLWQLGHLVHLVARKSVCSKKKSQEYFSRGFLSKW